MTALCALCSRNQVVALHFSALYRCVLEVLSFVSDVTWTFFFAWGQEKKKKKLSACRGGGGVVGLQLRVRFVPAALLAMLRTALALQLLEWAVLSDYSIVGLVKASGSSKREAPGVALSG
jgi:hypothetical protein